jgi:hypothetical protein
MMLKRDPMIFYVLEFSLFCVVLFVLITQIIQPFLRGTSYFPIIAKESALLKKLEAEKQSAVEITLMKGIEEQKKINEKNLRIIEDLKEEK